MQDKGLRLRRSIGMAALCVMLHLAAWNPAWGEENARLNVVLIVIDALRQDSLSCYGYSRATSPHIDAFASESLLFTNAFTAGTSTPPSMAAMMTGRYPRFPAYSDWTRPEEDRHGMSRFFNARESRGLPESMDTLAERLQREGYATAAINTNPWLKQVYNFPQGFAHYEEIFHPGQYLVYGLGEEVSSGALDWLMKNGQQPFFLFLHYMDVHDPYYPPEAFRDRFDFPKVEKPPLKKLNYEWLKQVNLDSEDVGLRREYMKGLYDCSIAYEDECIAQVLAYLKESGLLERTMVIITADHGEEFLEHGGTTHKGKRYEEMLRVPLILRLPGVKPRRIDDLVRNFDLMPTVLERCGVKADLQPLDAVSLLPLIEGRLEGLGLSVYTNHPGHLMVRDHRYKLDLNEKDPGRSELFDLEQDPKEQVNLYRTRGPLRRKLLYRLDEVVRKLDKEAAERKADALVLNRLALDPLHGFGLMVPVAHAEMVLNYTPHGVRITSGPSPGLFLPTVVFSEGRLAVLRVDLTSPEDTTLKLFYQTEASRAYSEQQCLRRTIRSGRNTLYLELPSEQSLVGRLRLDPGRCAGEYTLHSIEPFEIRSPQAARPLATPAPEAAQTVPGPAATPVVADAPPPMDKATMEQLKALGYF